MRPDARKIARSAPRPSSGCSRRWLTTHTSRRSCSKAGKARIFTPVREPSGESRLRCYEGSEECANQPRSVCYGLWQRQIDVTKKQLFTDERCATRCTLPWNEIFVFLASEPEHPGGIKREWRIAAHAYLYLHAFGRTDCNQPTDDRMADNITRTDRAQRPDGQCYTAVRPYCGRSRRESFF